MIVQQVLNGLVVGGVYALFALGFTLVFGIHRILNLAHGAVFMSGAFGEVQLNDLVQSTLPPSAYEFQFTLSTGVWVDCLLKLPNPPGSIAIDAKFPLESYRMLHAVAPGDAAGLAAAQRAFQQAMRKHINDIREKYILAGETAESALMFLPSEAIYAELFTSFPDLEQYANGRRVVFASPNTLHALLATVSMFHIETKIGEQAVLIQKEVDGLTRDVELLAERIEKLAVHFRQVGEDIGGAQTSVKRILQRGERIANVDLADGDSPPTLR